MAIRPADHGIFAGTGGGAPEVAGYITGGLFWGDNNRGSDKVLYATYTVSTVGNWLTAGSGYSSGYNGRSEMFGNGGVAGYWIGGNTSDYGPSNFGDRLNWPTDSNSSLGQFLAPSGSVQTDARARNCGFSDSGTAGYVSNGYGGSCPYSTWDNIFKFTYPSGSMSEMSSTTDIVKHSACSIENKGVAGYICGAGIYGSGTTIDKVSFTSDTTSVTASGMSTGASGWLGASQAGVKGSLTYGASVVKFAFATDTNATTSSFWTNGGYDSTTGDSFGEGQVNLWIVSTANSNRQLARADYATDTETVDAGDISIARTEAGGCSNNGAGF